MSPEVVTGIVSGLTAGGITVSTIPLIFRGGLRFERELISERAAAAANLAAVEAGYKAQIAALSESGEKLERTLERVEAELREQYRINADQSKELFSAVRALQNLAGLAARDRRGSARVES